MAWLKRKVDLLLDNFVLLGLGDGAIFAQQDKVAHCVAALGDNLSEKYRKMLVDDYGYELAGLHSYIHA
jgi:hypothetical protein